MTDVKVLATPQEIEQSEAAARERFELMMRSFRGREVPAHIGDKWWPTTAVAHHE